MPISIDIAIPRLSQAEFEAIDHMVMKHAFASQNRFGKLCDERVYENDIARRLAGDKAEDVRAQVPISVRFRNFSKSYYLDLVVNGMVYELKAERALSAGHKAQALNYAAMLNANRIKLINLGSERVEGRLLGAPFNELDRHDLTVSTKRFQALSPQCERLSETVSELIHDLGGFLSVSLYNEALVAVLGGESEIVHRLPVHHEGVALGTHSMQLHGDQCAFLVTSLDIKSATHFTRHLQPLCDSSPILGIQWINIHQRHVQLITIAKS